MELAYPYDKATRTVATRAAVLASEIYGRPGHRSRAERDFLDAVDGWHRAKARDLAAGIPDALLLAHRLKLALKCLRDCGEHQQAALIERAALPGHPEDK